MCYEQTSHDAFESAWNCWLFFVIRSYWFIHSAILFVIFLIFLFMFSSKQANRIIQQVVSSIDCKYGYESKRVDVSAKRSSRRFYAKRAQVKTKQHWKIRLDTKTSVFTYLSTSIGYFKLDCQVEITCGTNRRLKCRADQDVLQVRVDNSLPLRLFAP